MRNSIFIIIFVCTALLGCGENDRLEIEKAANAFDIEQARASILQGNESFMKAFKNQDTLKLVQSYTSNGQLLPCGGPPIENKDSLMAFYGRLFGSGISTYHLQTIHIGGDSTLVAEEGTYIMEDEKGENMDEGKYIVLWKREAGNWKMYRNMWTSNFKTNPVHPAMKPTDNK